MGKSSDWSADLFPKHSCVMTFTFKMKSEFFWPANKADPVGHDVSFS